MKLNEKTELDPSQKRNLYIWLATVALSLAVILVANSVICSGLDIFSLSDAYCVKARVTELGELKSDDYDLSGSDITYSNTTQLFYAEIIRSKEFKGQTVLASQTFDNYTNVNNEEPVKPGDKIVLYNYGDDRGEDTPWVFGGYARLDGIIVLACVFVLLLLIFGRLKGLNTIVSLTLTCMAVFMVFVPSVLAGYNIYLMSVLTCIFTIISTLLITNGATAKSYTTMLGCAFGVLVAGLLSMVFDKVLRITGMIDEHSIYLQYLSSGVTLNMNALIFGMIIIGAMGAVMDVAMDISSSLYEVHSHARQISFRELFSSGMRIGRDIMGTMANTLVLAYIGSQLCGTLLYITYSASLYELLNRESIVVEMMQALIGSMSILLTIPLTTLVCCFAYKGSGAAEPGRRDGGRTELLHGGKDRFIISRGKSSFKRDEKQDVKPAGADGSADGGHKSIIPDKEPVNFYKKKD